MGEVDHPQQAVHHAEADRDQPIEKSQHKPIRQLLEENAGLPTPMQFVRPIAADQVLTDSLVGPAQRIFAEVNASRLTATRAVIEMVSG